MHRSLFVPVVIIKRCGVISKCLLYVSTVLTSYVVFLQGNKILIVYSFCVDSQLCSTSLIFFRSAGNSASFGRPTVARFCIAVGLLVVDVGRSIIRCLSRGHTPSTQYSTSKS